MSDSLRSSRVTVTLGHSGRVVKRTVGLSDEVYNGVPTAGNKRSIKDRLGGSSDGRGDSYNKRQRGESTSNSIDLCLGQDDLRFKLMQKTSGTASQNSESLQNIDLREKLSSKTSQPSADNTRMRPPESAGSTRHPVVDPRVTGMPRHHVPETRDTRLMTRLPASRHGSELSAIAPQSYTSWTLENSRQRSPEILRRNSPEVLRRRSPKDLRRRSPDVLIRRSPVKVLRHSTAREVSPPRIREELQRRPIIRPYDDDGRSTSYVRISLTRAVRSSPYLTESFVPAAANSVVPVPHIPQASRIMQNSPSLVDTHPTVDSLLQSLGLDKYAIYFKAEEVDMNALRQLGDSDLKDLGIPMGPRKKILQAVMPRARRQL